MKQYRNKETGEIVKAEIRFERTFTAGCDIYIPDQYELYISTFRKIIFYSLKSLEREWEELTTNK